MYAVAVPKFERKLPCVMSQYVYGPYVFSQSSAEIVASYEVSLRTKFTYKPETKFLKQFPLTQFLIQMAKISEKCVS